MLGVRARTEARLAMRARLTRSLYRSSVLAAEGAGAVGGCGTTPSADSLALGSTTSRDLNERPRDRIGGGVAPLDVGGVGPLDDDVMVRRGALRVRVEHGRWASDL